MNFDRVADIYDETRGLPDAVVRGVADRIIAATGATAETRFLELGVGTGRIALPLIERGYEYTGVDISDKMLARLRTKAGDAPNLHVVKASVDELPLPDCSFDVIIAVHLLHLVPEWEKALGEVERILAPGGFFALGGDRSSRGRSEIRLRWREIVGELGGKLRAKNGSEGLVVAELTTRGWQNRSVPRRSLGSSPTPD